MGIQTGDWEGCLRDIVSVVKIRKEIRDQGGWVVSGDKRQVEEKREE